MALTRISRLLGQTLTTYESPQVYTVTVAAKTSAHPQYQNGSSNGFLLDGVEAPFLHLVPGTTYKFDQSDSTNAGHPLVFYYEEDKTTSFTTNVTTSGTPGQAGAYTQIVVGEATPALLYYQCSSHQYMGWGMEVSTHNLTNFDTDNLTEGTTNLYHTANRARLALSATGSLSYDNATGVMSYTERTDNEINTLIDAQLANSDIFGTTDGELLLKAGGNNDIRFATNDENRMYIKNDGDVCIGVTTPGSPGLSVATGKNIGFQQSNGESLANMFRQNTSGAFVLSQGYQYSSTSNGWGSSFSSSLSRTAVWLGNSIRFYADPAATVSAGTDITPTERMRINSTGSLILTGGGGTVTDTHGTASRTNLQLDGSSETIITFSQSGTTRGYLNAQSNSFDLVAGTGSKLRLLSNGSGSTAVTLDTSGNVGIGTTSPLTSIDIEKDSTSTTTGGFPEITVKNTNASGIAGLALKGANGAVDFRLTTLTDQGRIATLTNHPLTFMTNSAERMRLESDGDLHVDGDVIAYSTTISDQRLKDDVETIDSALDKVSNLRGVTYTWNAGSREGQRDMGVIAQEVEAVIPEIVYEKEMALIDGETYKTVDYEKLTAVLIEAVKELKAEVDSLKAAQ